MIDSVSSKLGNTEITTGTLPSYLDYKVTYSDGVAIAPKHLLASNTEETYKVRLEFKKDITANDLPAQAETLNLNFQVNYVQKDDTAIDVPHPRNLGDDDWDTIISNAQNIVCSRKYKRSRYGNTRYSYTKSRKYIDSCRVFNDWVFTDGLWVCTRVC